ncbi:MAG: S-layer homology domain-containing protein [Clostridia bacterium]|nr:S-layer homology domain-containing protein [Clostridia bacterium]
MKHLKRFLSILLCAALMLPQAATAVQAMDGNLYQLDDGYIVVTVSGDNGGFHIATEEGSILKKSDNNKDLLYRSGRYDTSFVSFKVGEGSGAREYLFGGSYPDKNSSAMQVQKDSNGRIVAQWSVEGITFTQAIELPNPDADNHGMVAISLGASGTTEKVRARVLLDTSLGGQDFAYYQMVTDAGNSTLKTEQTLPGSERLRSFYAVDDIADPAITAYTVSENVPEKVSVAHWNDLASTLFEFDPNPALTFTNAVNTYLTADSACALYYDLSEGPVTTYYGVYSNRKVDLSRNVAVNMNVPLRLALNAERTDYERQSEQGIADFSVNVSAENFAGDTAQDYDTVIMAIYTTSNLRPLDNYGQPLEGVNFDSSEPVKISSNSFKVGDTITRPLYFEAKPLESASYERITVCVYKTEGDSAELVNENLLGQKVSYILLPGSDGNIPRVTFNQMEPGTVYSSGTRHLYVAVGNAAFLETSLQKGDCEFLVYNSDDSEKTPIRVDSNTITFNEGIADIVLDDDLVDPEGNKAALTKGSWYLQLEWSDGAVSGGLVTEQYQKQTAQVLQFAVSDEEKYRNDLYGILAVAKYGTPASVDDPLHYVLMSFASEDDFKAFSAKDKAYQNGKYKDEVNYKEIPLVLRGQFIGDKRYKFNDENGKLKGFYYYTAVSKKTVDDKTRETKVDNMVTINNCLDFEGGTMTIYYEDYAKGAFAKDSAICVEFDGELYTSDERSSVWTGKAALTKLQQGFDFSLITYDKNGNRTNANSTAQPITLIWPNLYSLAQKLAGMVFKLAYGQLGVMKDGDEEIGRVISFSASLSLKFMRSPADDDTDQGTASYFGRMQELWKDWRGASIYQYAYNGGRYEKLTTLDMNDSDTSGNNKKGVAASVMVKDILFGCGEGFVGLNFTVSVGVKNMIEGLPNITGVLTVNTINDWSFGLSGSMQLSSFSLEASLSFKSRNDVPIPDSLYFFVGGFKPGLNIDGCGVVWLTGGGGGVSNIYDTIFMTSGVPPLKLILAASFSIVQILDGKAKLEVSLSGINLQATNLKIADSITVIKQIQLGLWWYPDLKLQASIYVDLFEKTIAGNGYIILLGKEYNDWFFEMFARVRLQVPESIPVVGGTTIAGCDVGISTKKIWGAIEVLSVKVGLTYYWGESSVHIGTGGNYAKPTYPSLLTLNDYQGEPIDFPVAYDPETGRTLYAHVGTNFDPGVPAQVLSDGDLMLMAAKGAWSTIDKTTHKFNLGEFNADNASTMVQVNYAAGSLAEARSLASGFAVTENQDGTGARLPLKWYEDVPRQHEGETDEAYEARVAADLAANETANANITWNKDTGVATIGFTVTDSAYFDRNWYLHTSRLADVILYNVNELPALTDVSAQIATDPGDPDTRLIKANWAGSRLDDLDSISFYLCETTDPEDPGYGIGTTQDTASGEAVFELLPDLPSGNYFIRAVYAKDEQLNAMLYSADNADAAAYPARIVVSNSYEPSEIASAAAAASGDLKYSVSVPYTDDARTKGYLATVYNPDGTPTTVQDLRFDKAEAGATDFEVGGSYTARVPKGNDPNATEFDMVTTGLTGGQSYYVGITPFNEMDTDGDGEPDRLVRGAEYATAVMPLPVARTPQLTLTGGGKTLLNTKDAANDVMQANADGTTTIVNSNAQTVFTASSLSLTATFDEAVTGMWTLDDGDLWELPEGVRPPGGFITGMTSAIELTDLTEGSHQLTITGQADEDGDAFSATYAFDVDTTAPRLLLSSPSSGAPFGENGAITVAGITDSDASLCYRLNGGVENVLALSPDNDGVFSCQIAVPDFDSAATHTIELYAVDPNGNKTAPQAMTLMHPGFGDLSSILVMADGAIPTDGVIRTDADAAGVPLKVMGVTSGGKSFAVDPERITWRSLAAEGSISVSPEGKLSYLAGSKGFVEGLLEVSEGAYLKAALALNADSAMNAVRVSHSTGGTAVGGGEYAAGETVTLTAAPDAGYRFKNWLLTGVTVADEAASTISFAMPESDVTAVAVFESEAYTVSFDLNGGEGTVPAAQTLGYGATVARPAEEPGKTGWNFAGWYNGDVLWNFDADTVTGSMTLTAHWTLKTPITPSVSLEGWTYGDAANAPGISGNTGNGAVTYTYSVKGGAAIGAVAPTQAGEYTLKAEIAESELYAAAVCSTDFTIAQRPVTVTAANQTVELDAAIDTGLAQAALDGALSGHTLAAVTLAAGTTGEITDSGVITPSEAAIKSGDADVTANYKITYVPGVLTVTDHAWGEWTVTTAPTCTEAGEETLTCAVCGKTQTRPVASLGHTPGEPVRENVVEPTEKTDGSCDEVVYCTVCGVELSREAKVLPATNPDKVKVTDVKVEDGAIAVTFRNGGVEGAVAIIALYDAEGRFIGLHAEELAVGDAIEIALTADQTEGAASAGVFVVDPSMKPEMAEGEIDIAEGTLLYDAVANFMNGTYTADNATMMFRKAVRLRKGDEGGLLKLYEKCGKDNVCPMAAYTDIKPTDWYHDGVHFVLENGIMGGTAEGIFSPEATATRAMIVRMLWNLAGQPEAEEKAEFADVAEDAWYADAVAWAACEGIVSGYGEDFGPDDAVTREQLAAILYGYAKYRGIEKVLTMEYILGRYTDGEETSDWAKAALDWAIKLNVLGGVTPDTLKPKAEATRAQVATMLKNFCTLVLTTEDK